MFLFKVITNIRKKLQTFNQNDAETEDSENTETCKIVECGQRRWELETIIFGVQQTGVPFRTDADQLQPKQRIDCDGTFSCDEWEKRIGQR